MKRLIIHIGNYKTGSTAVQNFLEVNRDRFLYEGIFVPTVAIENGASHEWARLFSGRLEPQESETLLFEIKDELANCKCDAALISSEIFFSGRMAETMREAFPEYALEIICYLRRQDHFLSAYYFQLIKHPNYMEASRPDFSELLRRDAASYLKSLKRWESVVGREKMSIHAYENSQLRGGLLSHFMSQLGIEINEGWQSVPWVNETIHTELLEFLRLANAAGISKRDHSILLGALSEISTAAASDPYLHKSNVFSPEQRLEILRRVENENMTIARSYLNRADGILFRDLLPNKNDWVSADLNIETLAQIMAGLWIGHQSRLSQLMDISRDECINNLLAEREKLLLELKTLYEEREDLYLERNNLYEERSSLYQERELLYKKIEQISNIPK